MGRALRIGMSSCIFHADPVRPIFKGKSLLYLEESMAHYVMAGGGLVYMIPTPTDKVSVVDLVSGIDGLVLQGGVDVSPESYGEKPMDPKWVGDKIRDDYEIRLMKECIAKNKPVFGICRGLQVMNVGFGGTLFQDIQTQVKGTLNHRDWDTYDQNFHQLDVVEESGLSKLYPNLTNAKINSVHHQSVKDLGKGLVVEGNSSEDGIIEAIRLSQATDDDPWCFSVQWHPEFQNISDKSILDPMPLIDDFYSAVRKRVDSENKSDEAMKR